jgi:hypothetical protein
VNLDQQRDRRRGRNGANAGRRRGSAIISLDYVAEDCVSTPSGPVEVSVARHEDGAVSVIAWLAAAERRIGYLHVPPRRRQPDEVDLDPVLATPAVRAAMLDQLDRERRIRPAAEPIGQRLIDARLLTREQIDDLLGWQWLLAELGEARHLGDLAVAAGLLPSPHRGGPLPPTDHAGVGLRATRTTAERA